MHARQAARIASARNNAALTDSREVGFYFRAFSHRVTPVKVSLARARLHLPAAGLPLRTEHHGSALSGRRRDWACPHGPTRGRSPTTGYFI
jgi:hypothetical protein